MKIYCSSDNSDRFSNSDDTSLILKFVGNNVWVLVTDEYNNIWYARFLRIRDLDGFKYVYYNLVDSDVVEESEYKNYDESEILDVMNFEYSAMLFDDNGNAVERPFNFVKPFEILSSDEMFDILMYFRGYKIEDDEDIEE